MILRNSFFLLVSFLICFVCRISAQSKALKIGDKVPDVLLHDFLSGDRTSMKLSELKGKLVILDFWATTCTPCVKAMPEMDALQKKFKGQIRILPIAQPFNGERYAKSKSNIEDFWKKNNYTNRTSLTPIADTILKEYFPFVGVPYEVWINGEGVLVGLTSIVKEQDILSVLAGNKVDPAIVQDDTPLSYDYDKDLLDVNYTQVVYPSGAFYTTLTNAISGNIYDAPLGNSSEYIIDTIRNLTRLRFLNAGISLLYKKMFITGKNPLGNNACMNRWVWEVKDKSKYIEPSMGDMRDQLQWSSKNQYCYESILPGIRSKAEMGSIMKDYLDRYFNLHARIEKRMMDCWLLIRTSSNDNLLFSTEKDNTTDERFRQGNRGTSGYFFLKDDLESLTIINKNLDGMVNTINNYSNLPVLNETAFNKHVALAIDIKITKGNFDEAGTYSPDLIKEQLKQYGLDLIKAKREMEVFVIAEKGYQLDTKF